MTMPGVSEAVPLLAYAPLTKSEGRGRVLRRVLVIVLVWAILRVAWQVIGYVRWGPPDFSQWLSHPPARLAEQFFMRIVMPLFNVVLTIVAMRGLRRGSLSHLDRVIVWSGVMLHVVYAGALAWLIAVIFSSQQFEVIMYIEGLQGIEMLPLILLLGFSGESRGRDIAWNIWGPAIGFTALLLGPVFWYWLTHFNEAQSELMFDLSRRSNAGNLGVIRGVGQLAIYAGLLGYAGAGILSLVHKRGISMVALASSTMLLAGLTLRTGGNIYVHCLATFRNDWDRYNSYMFYAERYGGLTLPNGGGGGLAGTDLAIAWGQMLTGLFVLFAFALLCRMAVPRAEVAVGADIRT